VLQLEQKVFSTHSYFSAGRPPEMNDQAFDRLLSLYPKAAPVRIPVRVGLPVRAKGAIEQTTIMFGADDTAMFLVNFPLCGGESVRVKPSLGRGEVSAVVVALMPKGRGSAVAVRFHEGVPKWFARA
jgi:hypothetical protein